MLHKFLDFLSKVSSTNAWIETRDYFAASIDEELLKALASITGMWRALLFQPTESSWFLDRDAQLLGRAWLKDPQSPQKKTKITLLPPSAAVQRWLHGPFAKSKFLAVSS